MRLLVTGGAGYIGSVVGALLVAEGHDVTVLDDLSTGHEDAVPAGASFVQGTLRDDAPRLLADGVDAVLHFAAKSLVGESMAQPSLYWGSNLGGSLALLEAMRVDRDAADRVLLHRRGLRRAREGAHRGDRARPGRPARTGGRRWRWTPRWPSTPGCTAWARSACATSTWPAPSRAEAGAGAGAGGGGAVAR